MVGKDKILGRGKIPDDMPARHAIQRTHPRTDRTQFQVAEVALECNFKFED